MANHKIHSADGSVGRQTDDTDVAVATRPDPTPEWDEVEEANALINPDPDSMEWRG